MKDIQRARVEDDPAWAVHPGEDIELVGLAVAVDIDAPDDPPAPGFGVERAVFIDADIQLAGRSRRQASRIADVGRLCEQRLPRTRAAL